MNLLLIDTTGRVAGAALVRAGVLAAELYLDCGRTHSQKLMPAVDAVLRLSDCPINEVDVLACLNGPGSFTGVRIGVSALKGMATAQGKPVVAVGTLEALAHQSLPFEGLILPLLDARRGQVYAAAYSAAGAGVTPVLEPCALALSDLLQDARIAQSPRVYLVGDGVAPNEALLREQLGERAVFAPAHRLLQRAGAAALLAYERALQGQTLSAVQLIPVYIRKSQAEQARERAAAAHT